MRSKPKSTRSSPLGRKVRELREWSGYSIEVCSQLLGCSVSTVIEIETGRRRASPTMLGRMADALDVDASELEALAALHGRPASCDEQCLHDGAMVPGGLPDDMRDECVHYDDCLGEFTKTYPRARNGHCPTNCTKRSDVPHDTRIQLDSGQQGDTRWDTTEAPGDISLPSASKKRLRLARHSGVVSAQLCDCSKCARGRERKSA
jgi:transcriptional regulator with XRE-family HTH domain